MPNKRQRKKQQAKQNLTRLTQAGIPKKQANLLKNLNERELAKLPEIKLYEKKKAYNIFKEKTIGPRKEYLSTLTTDKKLINRMASWKNTDRYTKEVKKLERNKRIREQRAILKELTSDKAFIDRASKYGSKRFQEEIQKLIHPPTSGKKLVILYRDREEDNPIQKVMDMKRHMNKQSNEELIKDINDWRGKNGGDIGEATFYLTDNPRDVISQFRDEYGVVYSGDGSDYHSILVAADVLIGGFYYGHEKEFMLLDFASHLKEINPEMAKRFAKEFNIRKY